MGLELPANAVGDVFCVIMDQLVLGNWCIKQRHSGV